MSELGPDVYTTVLVFAMLATVALMFILDYRGSGHD